MPGYGTSDEIAELTRENVRLRKQLLPELVKMAEGIRDDKNIPKEEKLNAVIRALKRWEKRSA